MVGLITRRSMVRVHLPQPIILLESQEIVDSFIFAYNKLHKKYWARYGHKSM